MYKMEEAGSHVRTSPHACFVPSMRVHVYDVRVCASAQVFTGICAWLRERECRESGRDAEKMEGEISVAARVKFHQAQGGKA